MIIELLSLTIVLYLLPQKVRYNTSYVDSGGTQVLYLLPQKVRYNSFLRDEDCLTVLYLLPQKVRYNPVVLSTIQTEVLYLLPQKVRYNRRPKNPLFLYDRGLSGDFFHRFFDKISVSYYGF